MKKIILALACIAFSTGIFAQVMEKNMNPEKPIPNNSIVLMPQANCPVPPVVVNVTQNNNSLSIPPANNSNGFLENKKTSGTRHHHCPQYSNYWDNPYWNIPGKGILSTPPNGSISNSFNTTTNNYYQQMPVKETDHCLGMCSSNIVYHWYNDNDWIITLLMLGLIVGFLIWLANYLRNRRNDNPPASTVTHTHTHKHEHTLPPSAPKASDEKRKAPVTPAVDVASLLEGLKDTGATATFFADGGFKVEMPKPPVKTEEAAK